LDRRFERVFRSFFGERNGELSMVRKSLHRLREMAGRGLLQDVPYLREVVKLTADQWNLWLRGTQRIRQAVGQTTSKNESNQCSTFPVLDVSTLIRG
jgi:hypothetical protein